MKNPIKLAILCTAMCAAMLAFSQNAKATTLNFNDTNDLGQVLFGIPSGDADRTEYVNVLISLAPGTMGYQADGQTFNRSLADPGSGTYPTAAFAFNGGPSDTINLGSTAGVFLYLFAKYDGPNAGSEVWYVGNLTGIITIPQNGLFGQNYGLSGWTLFTGVGTSIPDGGTTVMLLGAALGALGMVRRFLMS